MSLNDKMVLAVVLITALLLPVCGIAQAPVAFGDAWDWPLPARLFGELSQPERVQVTRAEEMLRKGNYEQAAVEFEKFIAQAPRSPVRPHALLLQGYAWHMAQKRGRAIEIYTEVLDFYAEKTDEAVPAAFLKATAQFQNGNTASALAALEDLVANPAFHAHPLCDLAQNTLAQHDLAAGRFRQAEARWRAVLDAFTAAFMRPEAALRDAHRELTDLYIRQARLDTLDEILALDVPYTAPKGTVAAALYAQGRALASVGQLDEKARRAFLAWFRAQEDAFERDGATAQFLAQALSFAGRIDAHEAWAELLAANLVFCREQPGKRAAEPAATVAARLSEVTQAGWEVDESWKAFTEMVVAVGSGLRTSSQVRLYTAVMDGLRTSVTEDSAAGPLWNILVSRLREIYEGLLNPARDEGLAALVDRMVAKRRFEQALTLCGRLETASLAAWKETGIYVAQGQYAQAVKACERVEELDSGALAARALRTRASLYKEQLARYDDAIKLFQLINDPPATIWQITDCQELKGDPRAAAAACSEIENFFEKDAPRAAYRKALIWQKAGDKTQAIAEARRVLKVYPHDQVASQAHQMLERYGIATGGGVLDEE